MTTSIRGSDVFLQADIARILLAIALTNEAAAVAYATSDAYRAGFQAALAATAVAFGLQPHIVTNGGNHELG